MNPDLARSILPHTPMQTPSQYYLCELLNKARTQPASQEALDRYTAIFLETQPNRILAGPDMAAWLAMKSTTFATLVSAAGFPCPVKRGRSKLYDLRRVAA